MKRVYIIVMILLVMPVCLHTQTIAPRRPLALDSDSLSTRKSLLKLREKVLKETREKMRPSVNAREHEASHAIQQKSKPTIE